MTPHVSKSLLPEGAPAHLRSFVHDSVGCMRALHQTYGNIVGFTKSSSPSVWAFGPEYNRTLLSNPEVFWLSSGFPGPKGSAHRRFGAGLFGLNGEKHQQQRRLLMPPFRKEAVESYRDMLVLLVEQSLASWEIGADCDINQKMMELSLRVTSKLLFGIDDLETAQAIEERFEVWLKRNHEMYSAGLLAIDCEPGRYEALLKAAEELETCVQALVAQRDAAGSRDRDVLSLLLGERDNGAMKQGEVIGHVHTLFNAAYHTTTSALTWTLFLLAQHPSVMRDLLAELEGHLHGEAPTVAKMGKLTLLDRVLKESMRLLPPVVLAPRINMEPTELGPYRLARGTIVMTSHYITHHMPELYPQPERFLPERWLGAAPSPYAYLPFGAGSRMCIGAPFAMLLLKIALPLICQRYRMQVVPGALIERKSSLTLGPRHGIPMSIHAQDGRFSSSPVRGNIHEMVELPGAEKTAAVAA